MKARCCTWSDTEVTCSLDELLPFDPSVWGADKITKLDRYIDMGGPIGEYIKPKYKNEIGEWFIHEPIFFNLLSVLKSKT